MSKKPFGLSSILIILGLLFIAATGLRTISTPEIWTHLAQGRNNAPLSYLASDSVVNTTHLYDKMAYAAWNLGGAPLLILLNVAGLLGTFILLLQVSKKWGGPLSQGFALLIAGHLMFQTLDVGPQVVMMLFIALFLYLLTTLKKPVVLFAALVPLQILWTNMHGSFLYGPLLAALTAIQVSLQNHGSGRNKKNLGIPYTVYVALAAALLVATVANPYLFKMHMQVVAGIKSPAPSYWSSLFIDYFQIPALKPLILFVMVLGAGGLITLKKKLPAMLTAMAIYGTFLGYTSPHMAMLFVVLSFPFVVLSLTAISEYLNGSLENVLGSQAKKLLPATSMVFVLLVALSLIPVVNNCAYVKTGSASNFGLGIQDELYPNDAGAIINDPAFPAAEKTINLASDGGYLAFKYNRKVFIDYRPGRYGKEELSNLNSMMLGDKKAYDAIYDKHRPEAFIINTLYPSAAQGIVTLLSRPRSIWKLAYFDGTTAILVLNKESVGSILNNSEAQAAGLAKLEKARADYAAKEGSCRAGNPAELIGSGKVFLALNRPVESKAIFSLVLNNNGKIPAAWIGLGTSQLLLGEFDDAVASLKTATKLAPKSFQAWATYANACRMHADRVKDPEKRTVLLGESERAIAKANQLAERLKAKDEEKVEPIKDVEVKEQSLEDIAVPLKP